MKDIVRIGATTIAAASVLVAIAQAGVNPNPEINFDNSSFTPRKANAVVSAGSTEGVWIADPNPPALSHNIRQDKRLFRTGPPNQMPEKQLHVSAGTYHYYCEVHGSRAGGMDGFLRVRPTISAGLGDTAVITWADEEAETNHRFAVQYRLQGKRWKDWKRRTRRTNGVFGGNNKPINANPNRTYQVRVRTFVKPKPGRKPKRSSRWSPPIPFQVGV